MQVPQTRSWFDSYEPTRLRSWSSTGTLISDVITPSPTVVQESALLRSASGVHVGPSWLSNWLLPGGGNFLVHHKTFSGNPLEVNLDTGRVVSGRATYQGAIYPEPPSSKNNLWGAQPSTDVALGEWGTTAISRVVPTLPAFSLPTMVGELKLDGVPALLGSTYALRDRHKDFRKEIPKAAASENLGVQFGWKPLLNDVVSLAEIIADSYEIIDKYSREANRPLRRRYTQAPETSDVTTIVTPAGIAHPWPYQTFQWSKKGELRKEARTLREKWFVGHFVYAMPIGKSQSDRLRRNVQQANHLLGIIPTPEVLWNLTPWSWMVDWYSNVGDVISNISSFTTDGLAMKNGWVMERTTYSETFVLTGMIPKSQPSLPPIHHTYRSVWKKRVGASPFGFALQMADLTPRQWSILMSLGLTRGAGVAQR